MDIVFAILFAFSVLVFFFLAANARAHAQAWYCWWLGVLAVCVAVFFKLGFPELQKISDIVNLFGSALAGALVSVAVTNRSKAMFEAESREILDAIARDDKAETELISTLKTLLEEDTTDPGDATLTKQKIDGVNRLIARIEARSDKRKKGMKRLGIDADVSKQQDVPAAH